MESDIFFKNLKFVKNCLAIILIMVYNGSATTIPKIPPRVPANKVTIKISSG
jgi:hypothetical protein